MVNLASIPPLVPLFAPYCGGVDRERELGSAIRTLAEGQLQGIRALKDGGGHSFKLSWSGELAPLATLACQLRFPDHPSVRYDFRLPSHQLVLWLMDAADTGLADSFWAWLFQGGTAESPP